MGSSGWLSGFTDAWDVYQPLQHWGDPENLVGEKPGAPRLELFRLEYLSACKHFILPSQPFCRSESEKRAKSRYYLRVAFINTRFRKTADSESTPKDCPRSGIRHHRGNMPLAVAVISLDYNWAYASKLEGFHSMGVKCLRHPKLCFSTFSCLNLLRRESFWRWRDSPAVRGGNHFLNANNASHYYSSYVEIRNIQTNRSELNVNSSSCYLENLKKFRSSNSNC